MFRKSNGFLEGILFAAVAALAFGSSVRFAARWVDPTVAAALYLTGVSAAFIFLVGTKRSARIAAVLLVGGVGVASALIADTLGPTAVALTAAIGVARARLVSPKRNARAGRLEIGIGVAALTLADHVARPSWAWLALAVWAYWLVQSAHFLVTGSANESERTTRDPFDVAAERANDLMDQTP
jgi:hypothetical protein